MDHTSVHISHCQASSLNLLGEISQNNNLRNKANINSCNLLKSIECYDP